MTLPGTTTAAAAQRSDRDRFVAFAFCWADLLIEVDEQRAVSFAAGPTEALLGRPPSGLKGAPVLSLFDEQDGVMVSALLDIARKQGRFDATKVRLRGTGGPSHHLEMAGYHLADMKGHAFLALRLTTPVRRRGPQGQPLQRDSGTGLYDSQAFSAIVGDLLGTAGNDGEMTLISLGGLDELRKRLDTESRESFMAALGTSLRAASISGDAAAQVGDERFVILHDASVGALELQQQLAQLAQRSDPGGKGLDVETASIPIGNTGISDEEMANGLIYAINRFRTAKGSGFSMQSLSTSLSSLVSEAVTSVRRFRSVLTDGEFDVVFQPIIDVTNGDIHHYEALCRFRAAKSGESPSQYIAFAEETGLVSEFDLAMLNKVVRWLRAQPANSKVSAAVNISGHSVSSLPYVVGLHTQLKENPWLKGRLLFEITESARMEDLEVADKFIQSVRSEGYTVCLDDFGAGAANFQYLSTLEVDVVKLDGSAVHNARRAAKGEAFLKALVNLCRDLGVETIAEMVDDRTTLSFIRDCGVGYAQGYLFGKPSSDLGRFTGSCPPDLFPTRRRR